MHQANQLSTTNVVSLASARRFTAPRSEPETSPHRTPEMVLISALLLQLREGDKASRQRFQAVQWQVGRGVQRYPGDPAFEEAGRLLDIINGAVIDREMV